MSSVEPLIPKAEWELSRRLGSGGVWTIVGKAAVALLLLAGNALLTRILLPSDVGRYALAFSMATALAAVAGVGLKQIVLRSIAESMARGNRADAWSVVRAALQTLSTSTIATLVTGAGLYALLSTRIPALAGAAVAGLVGFWMAALALQELVVEMFRGYSAFRDTVIFGGLLASSIAAASFGIIYVIQGKASLEAALCVAGGAVAASSVLAIYRLRTRFRRTGGIRTDRSQLLTQALPLLAVNITILTLTQADVWLVRLFASDSAVGVYASAVRLVALAGAPLIIINAVVAPSIVQLRSRDDALLQHIMRSMATVAVLPAVVFMVSSFFAGGSLLAWIFGDSYRAGTLTLAILSVGQTFNVFAGSCGIVLMLTGMQKKLMVITLVTGCSSVAASLLAGAAFGPEGVAAATSGGLIMQNIWMVVTVRRSTGLRTHADLTKSGFRGTLSFTREVLGSLFRR